MYIGRNLGVYDWWLKCHAQINGFSNAIYQSFDSSEVEHTHGGY